MVFSSIIADSFRNSLRFRIQYDAGCYTDEIVEEVLQAVEHAAVYFLTKPKGEGA